MIFERLQLETDEEIKAIVRRHWFFLLLQCLNVFLLMALPFIAYIGLIIFTPNVASLLFAQYAPYVFFCISLWLLINWMLLALIWTDHYLDVWTITDRRIIKIDQVKLFRRKISSFRLERLQDLSVEVDGILATFLDYGTIHAETASGHDDEFTAKYLPDPHHVKSLILEAADMQSASKNSL